MKEEVVTIKINVNNRGKSRELVAELEARFMDGERFTIEQLIKEYFNTENYMGALQAKARVQGWLNSLKSTFTKKHGLWFGSLNELGEYGLCQSEAEYRFVITRYYNYAKGVVLRAVQVRNEASGKGLLSAGNEMLQLPKIISEEKKK